MARPAPAPRSRTPAAEGSALDVPAARLAAQQLAAPRLEAPVARVGWFGALQAQDPAAARWAVALRLSQSARPAVEADVARALADGRILRTHALRGTWHLVTPADARDLLALSGPRVMASARTRHRRLGLDAATVRKALTVIARTLEVGHQPRQALRAALERAGLAPEGQRLSHLLVIAELEEVAVSGVPLDGQPSWAAFDERVPPRRGRFDRQAALAALALRYVRSRGPATPADLAWFAGATLGEARAALAASRGPLVEVSVAGRTVWQASDASAAPASQAGVHLLPAFDEYLVGYRRRDDVLDPRHARAINAGGGLLDPVVVAGGRVVGTWRRELGRRGVAVQVELFGAAPRALRQEVAAAAVRYGAFLGLEPAVTFSRLGVGGGLPRRSR